MGSGLFAALGLLALLMQSLVVYGLGTLVRATCSVGCLLMVSGIMAYVGVSLLFGVLNAVPGRCCRSSRCLQS